MGLILPGAARFMEEPGHVAVSMLSSLFWEMVWEKCPLSWDCWACHPPGHPSAISYLQIIITRTRKKTTLGQSWSYLLWFLQKRHNLM